MPPFLKVYEEHNALTNPDTGWWRLCPKPLSFTGVDCSASTDNLILLYDSLL